MFIARSIDNGSSQHLSSYERHLDIRMDIAHGSRACLRCMLSQPDAPAGPRRAQTKRGRLKLSKDLGHTLALVTRTVCGCDDPCRGELAPGGSWVDL